MRVGSFLRQLFEWAEKPCVLTIRVASTASEVRVTGVLRPYYSVSSLHGWALVPPQQHGGFAAMKLTQLHLADATLREVVMDGRGRRLRFSSRNDVVFELERDDAILTAPPRTVRDGRYLYVGGRRKRVAEPWMLQ
ncbi:MAG: hypothetical protein QOJ39_2017 [Candidatus Eremiobacteraeota bacterium]|nr:hypothetical protein [Candidatus Eremiobacteraeota bacterium]MEA2720153.1 hypothetical protein [Candidatus Eremiobacteraeota bacterium]